MAELYLWRRHLPECPHREKGRDYEKCKCPIWIDGYLNGKRKQESLKTRDWTRAEWKLSQMLTPEGIKREFGKHPLEEAVSAFLADCESRDLAKGTVTSYDNTLSSFMKHCAAAACFDTSQVTPQTISDFRAKRPGRTQKVHVRDCPSLKKRAGRRNCDCPVKTLPPSRSTHHKELATLRGFCNFCLAREWMKSSPAAKVKPPKRHKVKTLPFTQREVDTIIEACRHVDNVERSRKRAYALVMLLLYSGFRISDAAKFERSDLDLETGRFLTEMMKLDDDQLGFRLHDDAIEALLALDIENEQYFFWSGEDASDLDTCIKSLRRTLDAIRRKTGINVHPHRFRDTFAIRLLEHDTPIRTVQKLLGHNSVTTTEEHYAHWIKSHQQMLDKAVSVLDFTSGASGGDHPLQNAGRDAKRNVVPFPSKTTA